MGEITARYASPPRADASTESLLARVATCGLEGLNDAETLALLLSRSMDRGAGVSAAALLSRFGCLRRVLAADLAALSAIVENRVAADLRLIYDATRRLAASELSGRSLISSWSALVSYLKLTIAHCEREAFRVLLATGRLQTFSTFRAARSALWTNLRS